MPWSHVCVQGKPFLELYRELPHRFPKLDHTKVLDDVKIGGDVYKRQALDCAVELYQKIKELKRTFPKGAIVGAIFTEAGTAPNVVTPKATIRMTVRGSTVDDLEGIILPAIKAAAQEIAASYGAQVEMHHYEPLFKDMRQDKRLLDLFKAVMTEFGEEMCIRDRCRTDHYYFNIGHS